MPVTHLFTEYHFPTRKRHKKTYIWHVIHFTFINITMNRDLDEVLLFNVDITLAIDPIAALTLVSTSATQQILRRPFPWSVSKGCYTNIRLSTFLQLDVATIKYSQELLEICSNRLYKHFILLGLVQLYVEIIVKTHSNLCQAENMRGKKLQH